LAHASVIAFLFAVIIPVAQAAPLDTAAWIMPAVTYPIDNPYSEAKTRLGKQLFFDPRLSSRRMRSCASCHHPGLGWADALPHAMASRNALSRHTPSLINVAFDKVFFWDGRATNLEGAIRQHLFSPDLMRGGRARDIVARIEGLTSYNKQFAAVFGSHNGITIEHISAAIATFVRGIISRHSPFDRWIAGKPKAMPASAIRGFALFVGKARCSTCHAPPGFNGSEFHNTGLNSLDPGHFEIADEPRYRNAFKTPGLRHVALTAPYMHNGSKRTLEQVIGFYDRGGDRPAENNELIPLQLSAQEKQDMISFLKNLTGRPIKVTIPTLPTEQRSPPRNEETGSLFNPWHRNNLLRHTTLQSVDD